MEDLSLNFDWDIVCPIEVVNPPIGGFMLKENCQYHVWQYGGELYVTPQGKFFVTENKTGVHCEGVIICLQGGTVYGR